MSPQNGRGRINQSIFGEFENPPPFRPARTGSPGRCLGRSGFGELGAQSPDDAKGQSGLPLDRLGAAFLTLPAAYLPAALGLFSRCARPVFPLRSAYFPAALGLFPRFARLVSSGCARPLVMPRVVKHQAGPWSIAFGLPFLTHQMTCL